MSGTLRMVLATPLDEELCLLVERREPRVKLVRDHELLPPQRHPGDHYGDPAFRRTPRAQAEFETMLQSAEAIYGVPDLSAELLRRTIDANNRLRWVQAMASGAAPLINKAALTRAQIDRIVFTTSAGVHAPALAEFALFGLLAGAKELPVLLADNDQRHWGQRRLLGQLGDQRVLVVGLGAIGSAVARLLTAVGAQVVAVNRSPRDEAAVIACRGLDDIEDAARGCDAIVVALPDAPQTHHLVDARVLKALRRGASVVNVGRGSALDESALAESVRIGQVGFAALDVTEVEPYPVDGPLWALRNVLISPHTAALTAHEDRLIAELVAENATRLLDGLPLHNAVASSELGA